MTRNVYSLDFKKLVLREAEECGNATEVARKHGVNVKLMYKWKRSLSKVPSKQHSKLDPRPFMGQHDSEILKCQLEDIQSKLNILLLSNSNKEKEISEIRAITTNMEVNVLHSLKEMQEQLFTMMTVLSQSNPRIDAIDVRAEHKTTNNHTVSQTSSTNERLYSTLDENLDRTMGLI